MSLNETAGVNGYYHSARRAAQYATDFRDHGDRRDGRVRPAASRLPPTLGYDHPRWGIGGDGGMGAWSPLRYALRPRGAAAGFSPGAMGASRPDGLATSVEKIIIYMLSQKLNMYLPKQGWYMCWMHG